MKMLSYEVTQTKTSQQKQLIRAKHETKLNYKKNLCQQSQKQATVETEADRAQQTVARLLKIHEIKKSNLARMNGQEKDHKGRVVCKPGSPSLLNPWEVKDALAWGSGKIISQQGTMQMLMNQQMNTVNTIN